jgi:hypothetical protein
LAQRWDAIKWIASGAPIFLRIEHEPPQLFEDWCCYRYSVLECPYFSRLEVGNLYVWSVKMNIDLTDREMQLLIDCIGTNIETVKRRHVADAMVAELLTELADLDMDLREALHRQDDGWSDPEDPDLLMDPVEFAAKHDIDPIAVAICDAEINAETATSRAQDRRTKKFSPLGSPKGSKGDKPAPKERSEVQKHDVFDCEWNPSDPRNW